MWMKQSPSVRGIRGLICAMRMRALSAAALVTSTATPNEQLPCSSGGDNWMRATSMGMRPLVKRWGTSERKAGV